MKYLILTALLFLPNIGQAQYRYPTKVKPKTARIKPIVAKTVVPQMKMANDLNYWARLNYQQYLYFQYLNRQMLHQMNYWQRWSFYQLR